MAKILIIEDHPETRESLRSLLVSDRHVVDAVDCADEGMEYLRSYQYDALIVDWEMPGMTGLEFVRHYRVNGGKAPVLMLTGKSTTPDKVSGLDSGADYYLTKPFVGKELLGYLRASLRRTDAFGAAEAVTFKNVELRIDGAECRVGERSVSLSAKESAVLRLLMVNPSRIISHDEVRLAGWPGEPDVSAGTIRVFLTGLRDKLQELQAELRILSVRGYGYRVE